jgi:hypothetical protein
MDSVLFVGDASRCMKKKFNSINLCVGLRENERASCFERFLSQEATSDVPRTVSAEARCGNNNDPITIVTPKNRNDPIRVLT